MSRGVSLRQGLRPLEAGPSAVGGVRFEVGGKPSAVGGVRFEVGGRLGRWNAEKGKLKAQTFGRMGYGLGAKKISSCSNVRLDGGKLSLVLGNSVASNLNPPTSIGRSPSLKPRT